MRAYDEGMTLIEARVAPGVGVSNGTSSKAAFDRWFRYPAGLSQDALTRLFDSRRNPAQGTVVDPFCGAATVGTRAARHGWGFVGVEAHPEVAELGRVKLAAPPDLEELGALGDRIARAKTLPVSIDDEHDLVRRCFTREALTVLVALRTAIIKIDDPAQKYLKWALLATLRDVANVKVGWPYLRPGLSRTPPHLDVAQRFRIRLDWMIADLDGRNTTPEALVLQGDSGDAQTWAPMRAAGVTGTVALTSPPYLNNFDYADATRLEMFFWGRNASWADMVADVRAEMIIATTQQTTVGAAAAALSGLSELPTTELMVSDLVARLAHERSTRRAGKAYDRVLPSYTQGIVNVLTQLHAHLEPGSWTGWVVGDSAPYGVYVDTPKLIETAATEMGYFAAESEVLRTRGMRWRTNGTRHQVALNERLLWIRTPID